MSEGSFRHPRESGDPGLKLAFEKRFKTWIPAFAGMTALAFLSGVVQSSPPPGTYELYNGERVKTGEIISTLSQTQTDGKKMRYLKVVTDLERPGFTGTYRFKITDTAEIAQTGLISFKCESDQDGKRNIYLGVLRGKELVVNYEVDGRKFSTAFSTSSYDLTEFEMDLPGSKFRLLKPGESKTLHVFFMDRMNVVPVSRNVSQIQEFPFNDETAPVLVVTTAIQGKIIKSWFHAESGVLLQEEGDDYLMSYVSTSRK